MYNTIYTQRTLDHLAAAGMQVDDVDVEPPPAGDRPHHAPGRYRIAVPYALRDRGGYRELNTAPAVAACRGLPHELSIALHGGSDQLPKRGASYVRLMVLKARYGWARWKSAAWRTGLSPEIQ